jgi:hypothetical protein
MYHDAKVCLLCRARHNRHTAATRLVAAHLPLPEVGRVLGHTQANTTYRYVNANIETTRRAAAALDAFNSNGLEQQLVAAETEGDGTGCNRSDKLTFSLGQSTSPALHCSDSGWRR